MATLASLRPGAVDKRLANDVKTARDRRSPATRDASTAQQTAAFNFATALIVITLMLAPFAGMQLPVFQAFLPVYQAAIVLSYAMTGYLLLGLYQATRLRSLLLLSMGGFFTTGVLILQLLAFPGAFADTGSLIGGPQSLAWLWLFWHAGPGFSVLLFALSELKAPGALTQQHRRASGIAFASLALVLLSVVLSVAVFHDALPVMSNKGDFSRMVSSGLGPGLEFLLLAALVMLGAVSRFSKALHLWLGLTLLALLCDNAITMLGGSRLSLGWYARRLGALVSAFILPLVFLQELKRGYVEASDALEKMAQVNASLSAEVDRSQHDALTGIPARSLFLERAADLLNTNRRAHTGFACLFIDLDGFKEVNDRFGHERGDEVLQRVASILRAELRDADVAGRLGGDEFAVCLGALGELPQLSASRIAGRIVDRIGGIGPGLGASVGISLCRDSIDQALHEADEAMYESKKSGKGRSTVYRAKPMLAFSA